MLRGTEYKFCGGIVAGMTAIQDYAFADPEVTHDRIEWLSLPGQPSHFAT